MAGTLKERSDYVPTGYQMIRSVEITNYRCFRHLKIEKLARLNVVVGDNGCGKTSMLEAIFLALGTTLSLPIRFRGQRGLTGELGGVHRRLEELVWGDLFFGNDLSSPISVQLRGDGPEARVVRIFRLDELPEGQRGSIGVEYTNAKGNKRTFFPDLSQGTAALHDTGEDHPDFFHFPATQVINSTETAMRFSDLSRARKQEAFVELFVKEYPWLEGMNIEMLGSAGAVFASVNGLENKIPLPNVSGGINRLASILIAIAARKKSIVLVDEIENGVYYSHFEAIWRGLLRSMRETDGQMLATTHSRECLEALVNAADDKLDDVMIWRVERGKGQPTLRQMTGQAIKAGLEMGTEPR